MLRTARSWWSSLGLWRGLAFLGLAAALVLGLRLMAPAVEAPTPAIVAVLAGSDAKPVLGRDRGAWRPRPRRQGGRRDRDSAGSRARALGAAGRQGSRARWGSSLRPASCGSRCPRRRTTRFAASRRSRSASSRRAARPPASRPGRCSIRAASSASDAPARARKDEGPDGCRPALLQSLTLGEKAAAGENDSDLSARRALRRREAASSARRRRRCAPARSSPGETRARWKAPASIAASATGARPTGTTTGSDDREGRQRGCGGDPERGADGFRLIAFHVWLLNRLRSTVSFDACR